MDELIEALESGNSLLVNAVVFKETRRYFNIINFLSRSVQEGIESESSLNHRAAFEGFKLNKMSRELAMKIAEDIMIIEEIDYE